MRKSLLDILACPIDKNYPLELFEIVTKTLDDTGKHYHNDLIESSDDSKEIIITEGILFCSRCSRYYPIIEEIPIMLPDELREKTKDIEFLQRWRDKIPEKIIKYGNPWSLEKIR
jgi:uncharacterized protein YbaR (Trm112 family)